VAAGSRSGRTTRPINWNDPAPGAAQVLGGDVPAARSDGPGETSRRHASGAIISSLKLPGARQMTSPLIPKYRRWGQEVPHLPAVADAARAAGPDQGPALTKWRRPDEGRMTDRWAVPCDGST